MFEDFNLPESQWLPRKVDAPHVYEALARLPRAGWVDRGIENPETVKEHTLGLVKLAHELLSQLSEAEKESLLEMLEVHDWPEVIEGDRYTLETDPDKKKAFYDAKFEREKAALTELCKDIPNGEEILNLWLRFETSSDPAASFARQLDKYQAIEQAFEYEQIQGVKLFQEFLTYSEADITHPVLRKRIDEMKKVYAA